MFGGAESDFVNDFLVKVHSISDFISGAKFSFARVLVIFGQNAFHGRLSIGWGKGETATNSDTHTHTCTLVNCEGGGSVRRVGGSGKALLIDAS